MKIYLLEARQLIPGTRAAVFKFFQDPANLARITPPSLGFSILTPAPIPMHAGSVIDYTIQMAGLSLRWTTVIAEYDPPFKFADVQIRGPYSFWHHTHTFEEAPGGTMMTDSVRYALPFGPLGRLVNNLLVRKQVAGIFEYRKKAVDLLFSETPGSEMPSLAGMRKGRS